MSQSPASETFVGSAAQPFDRDDQPYYPLAAAWAHTAMLEYRPGDTTATEPYPRAIAMGMRLADDSGPAVSTEWWIARFAARQASFVFLALIEQWVAAGKITCEDAEAAWHVAITVAPD